MIWEPQGESIRRYFCAFFISSCKCSSFPRTNPPFSNSHPAPGSAVDANLYRGPSLTKLDSTYRGFGSSISHRPDSSSSCSTSIWPTSNASTFGSIGSPGVPRPTQAHLDCEPNVRSSDPYGWKRDTPSPRDSLDHPSEGPSSFAAVESPRPQGRGHSQRRPSNRDEFDGPHQFLDRPSTDTVAAQERDLPHVPINLFGQEQDDVLSQVNDRLSQCAFDFVAKYQFPIPLEADKRPVSRPSDREWTEWVYLLKRLATKRRIPARVLYNGQIKQLVTVLENSLEMRHAAKHQSRPLKDDRNVLQLISAGIQVAKMLKDASTMAYLDKLYLQTEQVIQARKSTPPGYRV